MQLLSMNSATKIDTNIKVTFVKEMTGEFKALKNGEPTSWGIALD